MKKHHLPLLLGSMIWPALALGQGPALTVSNPNPKPNVPVVIEVSVTPDSTTKVSWSSTGQGRFIGDTDNKKSVTFVPSAPGQVIIICDINVPGHQDHPSARFTVAGTQVSEEPAAHLPTQPVQVSPPHRAGDLLIADMEYMVPAGWMGDATKENNSAADLDAGYNQGCRPGSVSCIKLDDAPSKGKVGWAAFAWQRGIEGD